MLVKVVLYFSLSSPLFSIQDLVKYVESQGLKISELDIVTHFPKRSVLEMDQSSSLQQCGLYPRETVFVHLL